MQKNKCIKLSIQDRASDIVCFIHIFDGERDPFGNPRMETEEFVRPFVIRGTQIDYWNVTPHAVSLSCGALKRFVSGSIGIKNAKWCKKKVDME